MVCAISVLPPRLFFQSLPSPWYFWRMTSATAAKIDYMEDSVLFYLAKQKENSNISHAF